LAKAKERLDERLVREGLAPTRSQAQALILAGRVLVDDAPAGKAGQAVPEAARVRLRGGKRRYVSRGGEKLEGALADLGLDPQGLRCLDVGASTGGFTHCLLEHGAAHVTAVDVGHGQLDLRLRRDPRVHVVERTNARSLPAEALPGPIDLVTVDVSFISATLLLPVLRERCPRAQLLVMVKPQFEVGREQVGKGGVVRDPAVREASVAAVLAAAAALGLSCLGRIPSPIAGPAGNVEELTHLRRSARPA
jgi:23S rRNA (cytidine1920-2'-O)/16S rRNA (cytidine1409-2'-O)-methyltransferase